jgi:hypothetical protein
LAGEGCDGRADASLSHCSNLSKLEGISPTYDPTDVLDRCGALMGTVHAEKGRPRVREQGAECADGPLTVDWNAGYRQEHA